MQVRQVKRLPGNGARAPHLLGSACLNRIRSSQASRECPTPPHPPRPHLFHWFHYWEPPPTLGSFPSRPVPAPSDQQVTCWGNAGTDSARRPSSTSRGGVTSTTPTLLAGQPLQRTGGVVEDSLCGVKTRSRLCGTCGLQDRGPLIHP